MQQNPQQFDTESPAWAALCDLTTELFPAFGSRSAAMAEDCRRRPDLARAAQKPGAKPTQPAAQPPRTALDELTAAVCRLIKADAKEARHV